MVRLTLKELKPEQHFTEPVSYTHLGQRVMLPAAGLFDRTASPNPSGPVEIEKDTTAGAAGVFQDEMAIQQNRLYLGEERIVAIDVGPTRLHHADPGLGEMMDGAQQEILRGHEVGVEYGDELAFRGLHTFGQGPRLIAFAVVAMVIADWASPGSISLDQVAGDRCV